MTWIHDSTVSAADGRTIDIVVVFSRAYADLHLASKDLLVVNRLRLGCRAQVLAYALRQISYRLSNQSTPKQKISVTPGTFRLCRVSICQYKAHQYYRWKRK